MPAPAPGALSPRSRRRRYSSHAPARGAGLPAEPCILSANAVTNRRTGNRPCGNHGAAGAVHRAMNSTTNPRVRGARLPTTAVPLGGILLAGLVLGGCARRPIVVQAPPATVVQQPQPATVIYTPAPAPAPQPTGRDVIVIKEPPPPPREESPPPPPASNSYAWVPGYWAARDGRMEWVPGRYEIPPQPSATWVAPRWERRGDGYVFVEGYWR
jgi:hypothetical protein